MKTTTFSRITRVVLFSIAGTLLAVLASCTGFPSPFSRIDPNVMRVIAAVFSPSSDVVPGDTVTLSVSLAGLTPDTIENFQVTYNVYGNINGEVDTFSGLYTPTLVQGSPKLYLPDSASFSFVVPDTVFNSALRQFGVPEDSIALILALLKLPASDLNTFPAPILKVYIPIFQALSLKSYAYMDIYSKDSHYPNLRCRADFTVRLNRKLQSVDSLAAQFPVNENPRIRWLGVCKVRGRNIQNYHIPLTVDTKRDSLFYIYREADFDTSKKIRDTITIDTGYTYFMAADSGSAKLANGTIDNSVQKVLVKNKAGRDSLVSETFFYTWFYQNLDPSRFVQDSLVVVGNGDWATTSLLPPVDTAMHRCNVWVDVSDLLYGELSSLNRPTGMATRKGQFYMKFTNAYAKAVTKK